MKKRLLTGLVMTFFLCLSCQKAKTQITGIKVDSAQLYSQTSNCVIPATAVIMLSGYVTGTVPPNDSVTMSVDFGDGTNTSFKTPLLQNYFYKNLTHIYAFPGTFQVTCIATTSNSLSDTLASNNISLSNTCAPLTGRLYIDANSNCMYDAGETVITNRLVKIVNTGNSITYYAVTNSNGIYNFGVPPGNYTLTSPIINGITPSCPTTGTANVAVTTGNTYTNDFAYNCASVATDIGVNISASNWRIGFDRPLTVSAFSNNACVNSSGTITITLPSLLSYSYTMNNFPTPTVSGNTLTWNVTNLSKLTSFLSKVMVHCSSTTNFGDTICVTATITPSGSDANPANNSKTICPPANNSFDPNDKDVAPRGIGVTGDIENGTQLTYFINFQNTGNDIAYTVTIKDSLDSDLDISTLHVLKASHAVKPFIIGESEIIFRFDNINLPDSGSNEPASHGFVAYSIVPKAALAIGTQIKNTARIYFDFNSPIITNASLNTIANPQSIQYLSNGTLEASVFPNPANDNIYIELNEKGNFNAELYDMLGRNAKSIRGKNGKATLNVSEIPEGMYMLRLSNSENRILSTKITIQH